MIIIALADLHGQTAPIVALAAELAAAVVLAGDLTHFGHRAEAAAVVEAVRRYNPTVRAVAGNCDYPDVGIYLREQGIGLDGGHEVIGDVALLGLGGALPGPAWTPNQFDEAQARLTLRLAAEGLPPDLPLLLVSHQPPLDSVADVVGGGVHVGSRAVREFILARRPLICLSGHIHESPGLARLTDEGTWVANPGPARLGGYVYVEGAGAAMVPSLRSSSKRG
jgi:Icc-related predicted phosphoesterase